MATYTLTGDLGNLIGDALTSPTGAPPKAYLVPYTAGVSEGGEVRIGSVELDLDSSGVFTQADIPEGGYRVECRYYDPAAKQVATWSTHFFPLTAALDLADAVADEVYLPSVPGLGIGTVTFDGDGPWSVTLVGGLLNFVLPDGGGAGLDEAAVAVIADELDDAVALSQAFGSTLGVPISPWQPAPTIGAELWTLANMQAGYNTTQIAPSLTANSTAQTKRTRINLGNLVNKDTTFRIEFDYSQAVGGGWYGITIGLTDSGGTALSGTNFQAVVSNSSPKQSGHFILDFKPFVGVTGGTYFEVRLECANNAGSGTFGVSNVSLKQTGDVTRPMLVSKESGGGSYPYVYVQAQDIKTDVWKLATYGFEDDGNLTQALGTVAGKDYDYPWTTDPADATFVRNNGGYANNAVGSQAESGGGGTSASLRVKNNDQIMEVWNGSGWELRGNTHGGEYVRAAGTSYKIDRGAGLVAWTLAHGLEPAWRFQVTLPSEMRRSVDGTTPYCNVDHTITVFRDGLCRTDRTTTFLADTQVRAQFEWMSSHDLTTPYIGRIGKGTDVTGEADTHPKVATPGTITPSTSTSGGTLAAGTYSYRVSAVSPYGETLATSAVTQVTTGTTSTVTLNWTSVTNATGYVIYGRTAGVERLLARAGTNTFTDTGANVPTTEASRTVNTARLYNSSIDTDSVHSTDASWAVWRELRTGWCYGNIYDRETVVARALVDKVRTRLECGSGIHKNYANVFWDGAVDSVTVPAGTVWTATHYNFTYLPYDPDQYHREIAVRAANLGALGALYPVT